MRYLRAIVEGLRQRARRCIDKVKTWWVQHRERLAQEIGYSDAFAAVLYAAADLSGASYRVRYALRELVRAYVALQRIFSPPIPSWAAEPEIDT